MAELRKRMLLITYYWPPMGGGGVQRWLKMTKYMSDYGWDVTVYTPQNADVSNFDESLEKEVPENVEVIRHRIWEPFGAYRTFTGKSGNEKIQPGFLSEKEGSGRMQGIAVWLRGNIFIPDAKRFWIKPSVRYLKKYLKTNRVDAIVSTGPPHSNHLIAFRLKRDTGIKWLADFRDPWTNIDYYHKLMLTAWADKRHRRLEKMVLNNADAVSTVSRSWAADFEMTTGRLPEIVTNGYDEADFSNTIPFTKNVVFNITHIGSLNADRNPHMLWKALSGLMAEKRVDADSIRIRLIGPTDVSALAAIERAGLKTLTEYIPHKAHYDVIRDLCQSDLLLLPLNDSPNVAGVIPGKLYEYLASGRPILCIGDRAGDAAAIIGECRAGRTFDFSDQNGIRQFLEKCLEEFRTTGLQSTTVLSDKYSRRKLAGKIAAILDDVLE